MIGVIAGTGSLPLDACRQLQSSGKPFFVISLFPENKQSLEAGLNGAAPVFELPFYKVGTVLSFLQEQQATQVLLIGKVDKQHLLKKVQIDWLGVKLLASLMYKNDKAIMEKIVAVLGDHGMEVLSQDSVLGGLMVPPGILCGTMTEPLEREIHFGLEAARLLSRCDVGQTVIVKDAMIIAVEAIEGTDACIRRAIDLAHENIIICKGARFDQNRQYDLPTLGPKTIEGLTPGAVTAIAWQSTHTFIVEQERFIAQAQTLGITLVSV